MEKSIETMIDVIQYELSRGMVWDGRGGIRTVLVSLNLNGSALGSVPHTCASKHPHPIPRPFHQLVNYEFPRVRILNLDYRCLAVRPGFWDIENLVVGNHPVLLILGRGLPDYAEGGGGLWVSIDHLWRGPWHWREGRVGENLILDTDKNTDDTIFGRGQHFM